MSEKIDISNKKFIPLTSIWFVFVFLLCLLDYKSIIIFGFYATIPFSLIIFCGTPIYFFIILPLLIPLNEKLGGNKIIQKK
ncbi:cellulose synthase/poly-beta-1,6-N-acetylglucosamine synthase-like glycosyltransferase [Acetobacter lovaniensis]|uniref:Cellulose synthase/poly-beta-1,6-N-acetylglucosamine synthase-like glycosyltransferase n=1 Tax=Acetobacter lovaniensis TaxID=104100 RepID=A0A841QJP0_9PROT|nr:cellulose synthase/poly-beta-1,6-N-acetylglucosamine synthase-like glycosyltransferase [Acetobacter lovaniensis]